MFLRKADNRYGSGGVQGRKSGRAFQLLRYYFVNQAMLPELRAAMHDTVPYRCWCGRFFLFKKFPDADHRIPLAEDGCSVVHQRISLRVPHLKLAAWLADQFRNAREQRVRPRGANAVKSEFERGGAAIEGEGDKLRWHAAHSISNVERFTRSSASRGSLAGRRHSR